MNTFLAKKHRMTQRLTAVAIGTLLITACSSAPKQNADLDSVQARLASLQSNTAALEVASPEIEQASELVNKAQKMHSAGQEPSTISHQAYLANNQLDIANAKMDEQQASKLAGEKLAVKNRLSARENEQQQKIEIAKANPTLGRQLRNQSANLDFSAGSRGQVLMIDTTIFSGETTGLSPAGLRKSIEVAAWLEQNPDQSLLIEGYTSDLRDSEASIAISQERALSLKNSLVQQGIAQERIGIFGYGQEFPYTHNESETGRARNERMELVASANGIPKSRFESNRFSNANID